MGIMRIKSTHPPSQGEFVEIEEENFNPETMEKYDPEASVRAAAEAATKAALELKAKLEAEQAAGKKKGS